MVFVDSYWKRPLQRQTGLALLGWSCFLLLASLYCLLFTRFVVVTAETYVDSLHWSLLHYGHWLLFTPLIWSVLTWLQSKKWRHRVRGIVLLICSSVGCALAYQLFLISQPPSSDWAAAVLLHGPEQLKLCLIVMFGWFLLPRSAVTTATAASTAPCGAASTARLSAPAPAPAPASAAMPASVKPHNVAADDLVLVLTGQGETLIRWRDVEFVSAAANYVELKCGAACYLLRATMMQTEKILPAGEFIRVHRSHIVRIAAIAQIRLQSGGNGIVQLRSGGTLPLSKSYRQQLQGYRPELMWPEQNSPA